MEGYDAATYGDRFADVYDDWYDDPDATTSAVQLLRDLAASLVTDERPPDVLELGVGTGRLAIPLARSGLQVTGLDASTAMLARLESNAGARDAALSTVHGDMSARLPDGPFDVVLLARNTFFNLATDETQRACLAEIARVLRPAGRLVIEAFVPADDAGPRSSVEVRSIEADRVVLFVDRHDPATAEVWSSFVDITSDGVQFRPCHLRYLRPAELDAMASGAGLALDRRTADWSRRPFDDASDHHVSIYRAP